MLFQRLGVLLIIYGGALFWPVPFLWNCVFGITLNLKFQGLIKPVLKVKIRILLQILSCFSSPLAFEQIVICFFQKSWKTCVLLMLCISTLFLLFTVLPVVQLWTVNNYHWYLKQSLHFGPNERVTAVCWDPEPANRLHLICADGSYLQYTWRLSTHTSNGTTQNDHGWAAVIDGRKYWC